MNKTKKEPSFGSDRQKSKASWNHFKKRMRNIILQLRVY